MSSRVLGGRGALGNWLAKNAEEGVEIKRCENVNGSLKVSVNVNLGVLANGSRSQ